MRTNASNVRDVRDVGRAAVPPPSSSSSPRLLPDPSLSLHLLPLFSILFLFHSCMRTCRLISSLFFLRGRSLRLTHTRIQLFAPVHLQMRQILSRHELRVLANASRFQLCNFEREYLFERPIYAHLVTINSSGSYSTKRNCHHCVPNVILTNPSRSRF